MERIKINNNVFINPMPVCLVGAKVNEKPNFLTVAWVARVNANPPMIGVALGKSHHTNQGIEAQNAFSVNVPSADIVKEVDYCGLVSGKSTDKSEVFEVFYGDCQVPMIKECPLTMECRNYKKIDLPADVFYIGEVVNAYSESQYMTDGKLDPSKHKTFALTMPNNHYWALGKDLGQAWQIGRE